jgi:hypothetical protein
MRLKWCLLGCVSYCIVAAQSTTVLQFYQLSNEIDKNFVTTRDTISWLNENLSLLKKHKGLYVDLRHHKRFIPLTFNYLGKRKCRTYVKLLAKHSIKYDAELKSMINESSHDAVFDAINFKKIIRKNRSNYAKLYSDFNIYTTIFAGNYDHLDQGVRNLPDLVVGDAYPAIYYGDSLNLVNFYNNVKEYGFPKSKEIGVLNYWLFFYHTIARPKDYSGVVFDQGVHALEYVDSVLRKALEEGTFRNDQYAYFRDLASVSLSGKQIYGTLQSAEILKYPLLSIIEVDAKRESLMLPPLWVAAYLNRFSLPEEYER